ncbi:MAG: NAD(P)/FAD-dependent oxidoreductase [Chitinophagaceae bacterium]|nr:NAD(P)/FAD-dependent oxidoreductase [Chitinophagaceae bacterium]
MGLSLADYSKILKPENTYYDIAIAGGGLAGLALSIQGAKAGYRVIVIEKEKYPFHKVCGEYISLESWDFLEELGLPLSEMNLPVIRKLLISAPNGKMLEHMLPLGGFGISRYVLDSMLASIAVKNGVTVKEKTKVQNISFENDQFTVECDGMTINAGAVAGAFGKRSNIDTAWQRKFTLQKADKLNNYIGIKYHIHYDFPEDTIALHNFKNGYCGISRIEGNKYCLCYLTTAYNLKAANNDIKKMESDILCRNPWLKKIFTEAKFLPGFPTVISQISFSPKTQVEKHVLMIGDSSGMISPLCGNGMSMALHGSKIAFEKMNNYLGKKNGREKMEEEYQHEWNHLFQHRLKTGRIIQRFFGNPVLSNLLISVLKPFPGAINKIISETHGQPF